MRTSLTGHDPVVAPGLSEAIRASAASLVSPRAGDLDDVRRWFAARADSDGTTVRRVGLDELDQWRFAPDTGDLRHRSGGFFSVRGLRVTGADGPVRQWRQPIIHQPEIGILGILVAEIDGLPCLLMQAKMEPGNVNSVQLSPTVQATRSNYRRVHGGAATRHLGLFTGQEHGRVLIDVLQSEQGGTFYRKRNRNMIVVLDEEIPAGPEYRWLTLGQVLALLREDNIVNMNTRSVLSNLLGVTSGAGRRTPGDGYADVSARRWLNDVKGATVQEAEPIGLNGLAPWWRTGTDIGHRSGRYFRVIGVSVAGHGREVARWNQPLVAPCGQGLIAFLVTRARGTPEVLVHARAEAGTRDAVELAPTVQAIPGSYTDVPAAHRPPFLDLVRDLPRDAIRYDTILSEEGGRFYHAAHRYMIADVGADVRDAAAPPGYRWLPLDACAALLPHSGHFNVEARSLLACMQPFGPGVG